MSRPKRPTGEGVELVERAGTAAERIAGALANLGLDGSVATFDTDDGVLVGLDVDTAEDVAEALETYVESYGDDS